MTDVILGVGLESTPEEEADQPGEVDKIVRVAKKGRWHSREITLRGVVGEQSGVAREFACDLGNPGGQRKPDEATIERAQERGRHFDTRL